MNRRSQGYIANVAINRFFLGTVLTVSLEALRTLYPRPKCLYCMSSQPVPNAYKIEPLASYQVNMPQFYLDHTMKPLMGLTNLISSVNQLARINLDTNLYLTNFIMYTVV